MCPRRYRCLLRPCCCLVVWSSSCMCFTARCLRLCLLSLAVGLPSLFSLYLSSLWAGRRRGATSSQEGQHGCHHRRSVPPLSVTVSRGVPAMSSPPPHSAANLQVLKTGRGRSRRDETVTLWPNRHTHTLVMGLRYSLRNKGLTGFSCFTLN